MGAKELGSAALRLLNADPTASMAQIAAAAGVSRATLHRTFASRDELVRFLGHLSIDSWREALDEAGIDEAAASGDPDTVRAAMNELCVQLVRDADEYGFTLTEPGLRVDDDVAAASEIQQGRERRFYEAAQRAGVLRNDVPVAWIAHAVFGLLVGLREALNHGDIAVRDAERLLRLTVLTGVVAPGTTVNTV
ncbi:MAG TPA: TetR family transcriptional regulator [Candidatus Stackebrandtia excrementipullorum]|nr:TetR family transcriptional regulator [Candidatus Stackebrandtia excrementipullorum]